MFSLTKQTVFVDNVNLRAEKHGQENKLAFDVFMSLHVSNDVLNHFDANLKSALFKKGDSPQGELLADEQRLCGLRFPKIGTVKWGEKFPGYSLTLHLGINDDSDIVLDDVELDRFSFKPMEGGAVNMRFRAIVHPQQEDIGALCELIQSDVDISAVPPAPAQELNVASNDVEENAQSTADAAADAIAQDQAA